MRIDYTDENGAVIPRPESPVQEKAEPKEDTSTWGILKSGWGLFFVVAGALSVVLDLSIPGDFPLFRGDSFTLGWLFIVGVLIVPASCARHFRAAPINSALAVIWCIAGFVAWVVIHSITAEVDPGKPVRPNLALLGGLILCWRLLTKPRQECPDSVIEEVPVPDENAQVSASAAAQAASSPAKISLKQERQIKATVSSQPPVANIIHAHHKMNDGRRRVLIGGVFVICAAISIYALSEKDSPSLSWTLILCGMWSAGVWLWRPWMLPAKSQLLKVARVLCYVVIALLVCCLVVFLARLFFASLTPKPEPPLSERDAITVRDSFDLLEPDAKQVAQEWLKRYQEQQTKLGLPLYPSEQTSMRTLDLLPAFENFDGWLSTLPDDRRKKVENYFKFTPPENMEEERKHFLSVALISQRTQRDAGEVARNFETFYIPAFSKHEKGFGMAVPPKDANGFFDAAKEMLRSEHRTIMPIMWKPRYIYDFPTAPR